MADLDEIHSDEELTQASKDGTIREGIARIHFKLFPRYGFLIPENPLYPGETIFFGLTAHVDASRKYIADLRDELYADQRVKYMAVPVERDGTVKWKALVVGPLPANEQEIDKQAEDSQETWLRCTIHPNLQATHGFATPIGGNGYHDNVYFSLREVACSEFEEQPNDLTTIFIPGEEIKALVLPADPRFKAKYRAIKICKLSPSDRQEETKRETPQQSDNEDGLVDEADVGAVSWIHEILESKGNMKLTSLAGDLSRNAEVRNVVQPQKKSVKRFLSKYPEFFTIKEGVVYPAPDCPPIRSKKKPLSPETPETTEESSNRDWSSDDNSSLSTNSDDNSDESPKSPTPAASPLISNTAILKAFPDVSSSTTISLLADVISRYKTPLKMSEVYRLCQNHGWEGMKSVAMVAQIVTSNQTYFMVDERNSVSLSQEAKKLLTSKQSGADSSSITVENGLVKQGLAKGSQGSTIYMPQPIASKPMLSAPTAFNPLISSQSYPVASVNRRAYTPVSASVIGPIGDTQSYRAKMSDTSSGGTFPTSAILPPKNGGFGSINDEHVYLSDNEDSFDEKFKSHNKSTTGSRCTDEERRFLSVVARAICPNAIGGREEVFGLLRKELEYMGVIQSEADGYGLGGTLSRHLICVQLDMGKKPRAKFQVFTPSGKINQMTVSLGTEKITESALSVMLSQAHLQDNIKRVGRLLYGIDKTYHSIRMLTNGLDEVSGCTVTFRIQEMSDVRLSDLLQLGERTKVRILLSDPTTSGAACASLRKFAEERSANSMVVVVDMEGQIFGFGLTSSEARRMICDSLDMQQRHLKESVHHQPNYVIVNAVDSLDTLRLLERIYARGINIYAEVARTMEANVRNIFKTVA